MKDELFNKPVLTSLILIFLGVIILLVAADWYERKQAQESLPTFEEMNQEIGELEVSLSEMIAHVQDKDMDLVVREELLEEKNLELIFLAEKIKKMEQQNTQAQKEAEKLKKQLLASRSMLKEAQAVLDGERNTLGLIYRVQIGMLPTEYPPSFPIQPDMFMVEEVDEYQKYVLGSFRDFNASLEFRDLLRQLGVKNAWIVSYFDGKRMDLPKAQAKARTGEWNQKITME